ncbi:hypothetical protein [Mesorhizobium sp. M1E.F.Ca.ET.041.01.1.1]|uniref:hypothetical protein n=1 Tax=Mesorhizobium sp. M1E.F.Ca.ET.041.01.1.1 TaxID=2496759 RepID=UPI000FCBB3A3|nr:hypothetical protein [Mesorhizobium sp. M1E.F.Ca.ET.041.01.1.1]RUW37694.1 hypothetical protein EOA38_03235 [Mesorhizobium sp. M1E.F.Ca.ET.041.01.1.1]
MTTALRQTAPVGDSQPRANGLLPVALRPCRLPLHLRQPFLHARAALVRRAAFSHFILVWPSWEQTHEYPYKDNHLAYCDDNAACFGVVTSSSWILLEAKIEDLVHLVEVGSASFPYGGVFELADSKETISDAFKCTQSLL